MGVLRILSRRGDDAVRYDVARAQAGDAEAIAAVREAERIFNEARAQGATGFAVRPGQAPVPLRQFDEQEEQIIMVPRVVGG